MRRNVFGLGVVAIVLAYVGWRSWAAEETLSPPATAVPVSGGMPWIDGGVQWSSPVMTHSPKGDVTFHGPFSNETVYATAATPQPHEFVEVTFDLLILRTWDGSVDAEVGGETPTLAKWLGPDYFRLGVMNGPTLLYTTFSNAIHPQIRDESKSQNYPSQVPGDHLDPMRGAALLNTLGYYYPWPDAPDLFPMDATYRIRFVVPHHDASVTFELSAMNLQLIADENWGVTNLRVRAVPADEATAARPSAAAIERAFLASVDPLKADPESFQTLILGMDDTTRWIRNNIKHLEAPAGLEEQIRHMLAGDADREAREAATAKLVAMGPAAEPALRDARRTANAEARARLDWALQMIGVARLNDDTARRAAVATRVLEIIGTPEALHVRDGLTGK